MKYAWKRGTHHKVSADTAAKVCEDLEAEGRLTANDLVDVSRPEDAPLHSEFEWADDIAAEKWRCHQARNIINSIVIVCNEVAAKETKLEINTGSEVNTVSGDTVRKFFNVRISSPQYDSIEAISMDQEKKELLMEQAKKDMDAFERKYSMLMELMPVFEAMSAVKKNMSLTA